MSTLLEIEDAITALPDEQIVELARWLEDYQVITGSTESPCPSDDEETLAAQIELARNRMISLDAGRSHEIPGEEAHAVVRNFIARPS